MEPMLATLAEAPLVDPNLVYEPKYDGIRALISVVLRGHSVEVIIASRRGNEKTRQFPEVVEALTRWGKKRNAAALLDGEIVALDERGEPLGFERLQERIHQTSAREVARLVGERPVAFVAFDLLHDGSDDLVGLPLAERRGRLEAALRDGVDGTLRLARQVRGDGTALMDEARKHSWEGIVAKDARSTYKPGRRTLEWRKLKLVKRQELVVGGFTEPRGARAHFGALLLGLPTASGRLRYAGHVGGGFTDKELAHVARQLAARKTSTSPFDGPLPANEKPHWVRPELVAEVQFAEWTTEGYLRQPVYLGLRDDLVPGSLNIEVKPPEPAPAPPVSAAGSSPGSPKGSSRLSSSPLSSKAKGTAGGGEPSTVAGVAESVNDANVAEVAAAFEALAARGSGKLELPGGAVVELGNLRKPLWPALGVTKGDLFRYYLAVSPFLLPVVRDRPLVMKRFPDGITGNTFYQQRAPEPVPRGVRSERVDIGDDVPARLVGGDLATLLHMVQLAVISQDPWFSRAQSPQQMDFAAIDLDPMSEAPFSRVRDVARWVRDELDALGIPGWLKTSGSRGLHIFLPLRPGTSYESGMLFCQIIASFVVHQHPEAATVERTVNKRDPKTVYIDCLQNIIGKTLACAYSARASDYAGASTPLAWDELDDRLDPRAFTIQTLPARLAEVGDLWAGLRQAPGIDLGAALERAQGRNR
jgi:bifunctional non-homologous end joining protein LigD